MFTRRRITVGAAAAALALTATACNGGGGANNANQQAEAQQLNQYNASQPLPIFNKSQLRQTLIEVETAQSQPTPTTTFFFNQGVQDPVSQCPSVGFPVPTTDQVSNPQQLARTGGAHNVDGVIPQIDPNGIYSGDSTGTYVLCLNEAGKPFAQYWEGFVMAVSGSASWNTSTHSISNIANPTGNFTVLPQNATGKVAPATPKP